MRHIAGFFVAALLVATGPAGAQADAAETTPRAAVSEAIDVNEVLLDVLVTDKKGNVILGLGKDDFVVKEDGEAVPIEDVTFYSNRRFLESSAQAEELGIDPRAVPTDRYFVLFFHDQRHLLFRLATQQLEAGRRAEQWVRSALMANDYVAVVSYQHALKLHQDFTNDPDALARAIQEATLGRSPRITGPADEGVPSLFANLPPPRRKRYKRIYDALEAVGTGAGAVRGRTNLILFSTGFGEQDGFGFSRPDMRYYPRLVRALNGHNVAVYAIDLIPTGSTLTDSPDLLDTSLSSLAADTGGEFFFNFISFHSPLEEIGKDLSGYYLISYKRPSDGKAGYQKVEVDTVNPELKVRSREGYQYGV